MLKILCQKPSMTHLRCRFCAQKRTTVQILSCYTLNHIPFFNQFSIFHNILIPRKLLLLEAFEQPLARGPFFLVFISNIRQFQQKSEIPFMSVETIAVCIFQANINDLSNSISSKNVEHFFRRFSNVTDREQLHTHTSNPFSFFSGRLIAAFHFHIPVVIQPFSSKRKILLVFF